MLEELEEFTEREKKFENKYVKTINELKSEAFNTENELAKVSSYDPCSTICFNLNILPDKDKNVGI